MLMWALTVLPPGAEDLALRTLSSLLAHSHVNDLLKMATQQLTAFLSGKSTLAEAALRQAAWWQEVRLTIYVPASHYVYTCYEPADLVLNTFLIATDFPP